MRSLVVASLVFVISLGSHGQKQPSQNHKEPDQKAAASKRQAEPVAPTPIPQPELSASVTRIEAASKQQDSQEEPKPWLSHGELVMAILTVVYVGITAFYAYVSHRTLKQIERQGAIAGDQLNASVKAANAAEDSSNVAKKTLENVRLDQRPWVVTSGHIKLDVGQNNRWVVAIHIKNVGKTLAINVNTQQILEITNEHLNRWSYMGTGDPNIILFPATDHWIHASSDQAVADDDKRAIQNGKRFVYAHGMIRYKDGFGDTDWHDTQFCYLYNPITNAFEMKGNNSAT